MKNHEFNTASVADGTDIDLYTAIPEGQGPFPALIVLQEAYGVNHHIRTVAERLCKEGYAVVAPDLFHRTARRLEVDYTDFNSAMPHFQALTKDTITEDVKAAYNWLLTQDLVLRNKIGSIGFCLGGRASFLANAALPLSAAVSYYGGGIDQLTSMVKDLHGPHLFFWGGKDKHITPDKVEIVIDALKAAEKDHTNVVISYADHAFNCDERPSYHPLAAKEAWAHTLAFLENRLK